MQPLPIAPEQELNPVQLELYRKATPEQKLRTVARLNSALIALKEAQLQTDHPEMAAEERRRILRSWWLTARD